VRTVLLLGGFGARLSQSPRSAEMRKDFAMAKAIEADPPPTISHFSIA
jgi:hypothetical protein